jgi:hypothetical protein
VGVPWLPLEKMQCFVCTAGTGNAIIEVSVWKLSEPEFTGFPEWINIHAKRISGNAAKQGNATNGL